ncbi:MAG TPA: Crp/Fnr family transcriptional regulator [Pyrinomonadaceae bacterium]|nr:Crp/Fnr family transcriptional regulator [Pyrinomonadaceae bacterium]
MLSPKSLEDQQPLKPERLPVNSLINEVRGLGNLRATRSYPRGSVVFSEGQRLKGVYLLTEGRAKVCVTSPEGKTLVLRIAMPGDLLGMNSVLTGKPARATVEALERCRIDFVARKDFLKWFEQDQKGSLSVVQALSEKLGRVMDQARLLLLSDSAAEKLAKLLLQWCDEQGERSADGIEINARLTHAELAQLICTSRETVTRLLGDFQRRNIISFTGHKIIVRNRASLASVARV